MTHPAKPARYGYHVPHLVLSGLVGGGALLLASVVLLAATTRSPLILVVAGGGIVVGLGLLLFTVALRWLVVRGRPLMTERMLDTVTWTGAERVLDVGCGPGLALIAAAKRLTSGKAVGLDKWMVIHGEVNNSKAITLENARIEGVEDRVEVQDGDASAMPFADASFDVVVSSFVFHHLPHDIQHQALREIARVTKPGGRILITDDRTGELAAALRKLGLTDVSNRRLVFPIHLLSARRASAVVA
ncbi:MAG: class I SAM-dependent methyltransferase [Deltaproteobacteria bacterium]|nr:class I SAM-dependent methyltransferase [Deltaproteobacteria bacterium]